jgi:hypothetical protein
MSLASSPPPPPPAKKQKLPPKTQSFNKEPPKKKKPKKKQAKEAPKLPWDKIFEECCEEAKKAVDGHFKTEEAREEGTHKSS